MRSTFKKRLASLFVIFALLLVAVTGCGANGTREPIQPDSQGQISSTDDTTGQKQTSGDENAETTSSESGEDSTEDSTDTESTTDNKPGAIEPTTGNKPGTTEPTTGNKPGTIEPTTGNKPGTTEPTTGNKPGTIEPTTGNKPGTTEPTAGEKPSATEPTTTKKPSTTEPTTTKKPSTTEPTTTKKPSTTESTTTQKPTTTQPTTTKKPATTTTQKPTTSSSSGSSNLTNAEKMAKEIVDDIISSNMTDFQKAITIHDWLIFNLDYDFTYTHYYVEETLRDRTCVCQGYALTFQMMAEMAGLGVTYVTGTGTNDAGKTESHAWNQVKIDGKWYNVDVTWDDPASPGKNFNDHTGNRYDYFLISDARINKNHKATSSGRQTCSSDYDAKAILKHAANSGLHKNVAFVTSKSEVATAIKKAVEANKTELTLWYYDTTVTEATMWSVLDGLLVGAPYPAQIKPSYPPVNGVTKYILALTPLSEWNKMTVATSASQLTALIDSAFDSGKTTLTVRYEPTNGNLTIYGGKYGFRYVPSEYNDGKAVLLVITEPY